MANSQVVTAERASKRWACRQTPRNTSLVMSSASASLPSSRNTKTVDARMMPCEQDLHRESVAGCDLCDQRLVRVVFGRGRPPLGGNTRDEPGKVVAHW